MLPSPREIFQKLGLIKKSEKRKKKKKSGISDKFIFPNGKEIRIDTKRFTNLEIISRNQNTNVISGFDNQRKVKVAIKRVVLSDNIVHLKRILREIMIMKTLKYEKIVTLYEIMLVEGKKNTNKLEDDYEEYDDEVYFVMDLMQTDLRRVISGKKELTEDQIKHITHQILCALKYVSSSGVVHCDIKPSNILLNGDCSLKICDFGHSLGKDCVDCVSLCVSPAYRSPEILLGDKEFSSSIDIWSIGCVFAEMFCRKPLFIGENPLLQFVEFGKVLGRPNTVCSFCKNEARDCSNCECEDSCIVKYDVPKEVEEKIKKSENETQKIKKKEGLKKICRGASDNAIDLISKMLCYNKEKRITIDEALGHKFFKVDSCCDDVDNEEFDDIMCPYVISFKYENDLDNSDQLKKLIKTQISSLNKKVVVRPQRNHLKLNQ